MNPATRITLLQFARDTIAAQLAAKELPPVPVLPDDPGEFGGAFVTLRHRGRLRGCIGRFHPERGLAATVQAMAVAALSDPRFTHCPVTPAELNDLHIEISILSKMQRTLDPLQLEPGVHGIYIRSGQRGGCFLPQVATEQRWDIETFLARCCTEKAGLAPDAWRDPATEVYAFTADLIEEQPPV